MKKIDGFLALAYWTRPLSRLFTLTLETDIRSPEMEWKGLILSVSAALSDTRASVSQRQK